MEIYLKENRTYRYSVFVNNGEFVDVVNAFNEAGDLVARVQVGLENGFMVLNINQADNNKPDNNKLKNGIAKKLLPTIRPKRLIEFSK